MTAVPETLLGLVQCYSPSGNEREAVNYLVDRMASLGFEDVFQDQAGNGVGTIGSGPKQLVLLGHIDTVPGEIPVRVEGETLFGRGTVDAKGPLAAFVDSVAQVGPMAGWQFVVIGALDEERESRGARYLVDRYSPDLAIIGEPSCWDRVTLGYKGSLIVKVTVQRPVAHPAGGGESAPEAAIDIWRSIQSWVDDYNTGKARVFDQVQASLRHMASEQGEFQGWASLVIGFRSPLELSPGILGDHLTRITAPAELEILGQPIPAYRSEKNNPLVRAFLPAIRALGGEPRFVVKTGTADINIVAPTWNCPTVAYGPGDSRLDHTPQEGISLIEYTRSVEVLAGVLSRVCQPS
ncbi:MAG: [LysW]-lysine hydrolase [Anaerolineales bacterium]|jgi:LysW-gamma-L-lysine carboxypeptidase